MVLVLIHLIRQHALVGFVLFFFHPEHQAVLERMMLGEQYTAQLELGQSLTTLTCLWAGRTVIHHWEGKLSYSFPFWKVNVSYIGIYI